MFTPFPDLLPPFAKQARGRQPLDTSRFDALRGIQHGAVLQGGKLLWDRNGYVELRNWASSARGVIADSCWLRELSENEKLRSHLSAPLRSLKTPTSLTFPPSLTLKQALWYIGINGRWHYSNWWREMDDVFKEITQLTLAEYFNIFFRDRLPGIWAVSNKEDGTPRFYADAIGAAEWGEMTLRGFCDQHLWNEAITPMEYELEGMGGLHLIRNGKAWELDLPGVPDGWMARDGSEDEDHGHGAIVVLPSLDAVMAVRGATPEWWLPDICEILR